MIEYIQGGFLLSIYKTFIALLMSFAMLISNGITALLPGTPPEPKSEAELMAMADIFDEYELSDEIYVVRGGLSRDENTAIQSLQGLVSRDKATIFLDYGHSSAKELAELDNAGYKILCTDENGANWNLKSLVTRFSEYINNNSYVLYTSADVTEQVNMAFNYATVYGCLAVPESAEEIVKALGMTKSYDLTESKITISDQREFYEAHKDEFRKDSLVHLYAEGSGVRDFAIQQKIFITFAKDDNYIERAFREELLADLEPASVVLGWCQYEVKYTEAVSAFGHFVVPSDHNFNMTLLNAFDAGEINLGKEIQTPELNPEKHYIAIVFSDGDNAQWIANGFSEFYKWRLNEKVKLG